MAALRKVTTVTCDTGGECGPKGWELCRFRFFPSEEVVCSNSEDCSGVRVMCGLCLEAGVEDGQVKPRTIPLWTRVSSPLLEVSKQRQGRCGIKNSGCWIAVGLDDPTGWSFLSLRSLMDG